LSFSFALATPTLLQQQVVKLILLITQVAPLTLEGNLNSNMAISKGVSKHHGNQEHSSAWDHEKSFGGHKDDNVDRSADFHTYAVEWDESNLNFYFDDKKFASYNRPTEIKQLDKQYIIINLAIGG
jgi:hypothetical protein